MKTLTPPVDCSRGAPMGRLSDKLDSALPAKARRIPLSDGYDRGGAYWGNRMPGQSLYAVWQQAGRLVAFVDATSESDAIMSVTSFDWEPCPARCN